MPSPANSINEATTGVMGFTGTAMTATAVTQYNVITGAASSSTLNNVAPSATSGVPLISQGNAAQPIFGTAVVAGGGTGAVTLTGVLTGNGTSAITASTVTQHGVLVGGASNAVSSTAVGSTGQVLQANSGADPTYSTATFPSTATSTGTILRADGTNWVATTATYPATTTANQLLVSTATNVVGGVTAGATGTVLTGVTGAVPAFSATPTVTSITFGSGTALSSYVQNTFTPTLKFGGATTGITYGTQTGEYAQIGNIIYVTINIVLTSKGSATGAAQIFGLPVASGANISVLTIYQRLLTNTVLYTNFLAITASASSMDINQNGSGQADANATDTNFANNSHIRITGFYFTS
jgi:hypothetical protein